jgi:hypothetical protein
METSICRHTHIAEQWRWALQLLYNSRTFSDSFPYQFIFFGGGGALSNGLGANTRSRTGSTTSTRGVLNSLMYVLRAEYCDCGKKKIDLEILTDLHVTSAMNTKKNLFWEKLIAYFP